MPLSSSACRARRERLIAAVDADILLINNPRHIMYFTGMFTTELLLSAWGLNTLIIDARSGKTTLVAHNAMGGQLAEASVDEKVIFHWYDSGVAAGPGGDMFGLAADTIAAQAKGFNGRIVAAENGWLPQAAGIIPAVDLNATLVAMRRRKDPDELDMIREAIRVVEAAHRAVRAMTRPGVTELDVWNALMTAATLEYGHPIHMICDFISGERAKHIGGFPTNRVLQSGDVLIADLFPIVNGYRADFTATVAVDDRVSENQKRLDTAIHEAFAVAEALLKPGTICGDVYRAVRAALGAHGFAGNFPHHAGHGLGLDHPEAPFFVPDSTEILVVGDVVTVEPGAYGDDYAARVENNYLITETGFEKLTHHETRLFSD